MPQNVKRHECQKNKSGNGDYGLVSLSQLSLERTKKRDKTTTELIFDALKQAARAAQNGQVQRFYSIRDVASHFDIPRSTVSRMFNQLKHDGVLTSAWGSRTLLQPAKLDRHVGFRGILAMLTPTERFPGDTIAQRRYREIWTTLWRGGFAARVWLYNSSDADSSLFINSVLAERPDCIVWLMPNRRVTLLNQRLLDCGVRVIRLAAAMTALQMLQEIANLMN
jgi:hypothetical protein